MNGDKPIDPYRFPATSSGPPVWFVRVIDEGDEGDDVKIVQRKVDAPITGVYDPPTQARVRGVQKKMGRKKQTGVVDAETAQKLGPKATAGQVPDWFGTDEADLRVRDILRLSNIEPLVSALRRFQSANGMKTTGELDKATAIALADRSF